MTFIFSFLSFIISNTLVYSYTIHVNITNPSSKHIWNVWKSEITWDFHSDWMNTEVPSNRIKSNYPFLERIEMFTATGGCYSTYPGCSSNRDLLSNPSDYNSPYNFTTIGIGIENILKQNLIPYIVTGNIPIIYSGNNTDISSSFGVNKSPPNDYNKYSNYITSLAQYLINKFDENIVSTFYWGVFTEYNNYDWFEDNINKSFTEIDYFKLYDYTSCSLQKAFKNNNFKLGAHGCTQCTGNSWNNYDLLKHIANQENYCTLKTGETPINFYSVSFYEISPGNPGNLTNFNSDVCSMSNKLNEVGLNVNDIELGIDEGRILFGPSGLPITSRAIGDTYQASFDSLLFLNMIKCNISWYSRWNVNNQGNGLQDKSNIVDPVSTNVARLTYKMNGNNIINMTISNNTIGNQQKQKQIVDGIASINSNLIQIFIFNHLINMNSNISAIIDKLYICGLGKNNLKLNITKWMIDDNNSQYWNIFWSDVIQHNITSFCPVGWSNHSETIGLCNSNDENYFKSRLPVYQKAAQLKYSNFIVHYQYNNSQECFPVLNNEIIPHHGVRLFEIEYIVV